jgi:hypothetical protein
MIYVPGTSLELVQESLAHFTGAGGLLKEVCAINLELLRRREPFEEST